MLTRHDKVCEVVLYLNDDSFLKLYLFISKICMTSHLKPNSDKLTQAACTMFLGLPRQTSLAISDRSHYATIQSALLESGI